MKRNYELVETLLYQGSEGAVTLDVVIDQKKRNNVGYTTNNGRTF